MSQIADAAKTVACGIWSVSPARLLARFPGAGRTAVGNFAGFMNDLCDLPPGPTGGRPNFTPGPERGRCQASYFVTTRWRARQIGSSVTNSGSGEFGPIPGPISGAFVFRPTPTFRGAYIRGADGINYQVSSLYSFSLWTDFTFAVTGSRRADNQADNCGQPTLLPGNPDVVEGDEDGVDTNISVNIDADTNIDIPITLLPNLNPPGIDVSINGEINFNFNAGGINFNVGGNNESPGLPPSVQDQLDNIEDKIDNIESGGNENFEFIVNQLEDIQQTQGEQATEIEQVQNQLNALGSPLPLETTNEQDKCLTEQTPITTVFDGLRVLSKELRKDRQESCFITPTEEVELFSGTSSKANRVFYLSVPASTIAVVLDLTGDLPQSASYYQTNEATGNFGAISAINAESRMMETRTVFTRQTRLDFETPEATSGVRVFLIPGVNFRVTRITRI